MKKTLLFCGALLALTASMAQAQGINFAWRAGCWVDNPTATRTVACNSDTAASHTAAGSFMTANAIPDFVGIEVVVDLQSASSPLPAWWQFFNAGSCRNTSLSASGDFTTA